MISKIWISSFFNGVFWEFFLCCCWCHCSEAWGAFIEVGFGLQKWTRLSLDAFQWWFVFSSCKSDYGFKVRCSEPRGNRDTFSEFRGMLLSFEIYFDQKIILQGSMQVLWEKAISKKLYAKVPHRELLIGTC